jgi:hypothetical protein
MRENPEEPVKAPQRLGGRHVSRVEASPFCDDIVDLLQSRWSPGSVERYLRTLYADYPDLLAAIPGRSCIQRYREAHVPDAAMLPESFIQKKLAGIDVKINVLEVLSGLVPSLIDRIGRAMEVEEGARGGFLMEEIDGATRTLVTVLGKIWEIGQDVGMYPSRPVPPTFLQSQTNVFVGTGATPEVEEEVLVAYRALYENRTGRSAPRLAAPPARDPAEE